MWLLQQGLVDEFARLAPEKRIEWATAVAKRMKAAGLYSPTTYVVDITRGLVNCLEAEARADELRGGGGEEGRKGG